MRNMLKWSTVLLFPLAIQANAHWLQIVEEQRDYDLAKADFMRHNP